MRGARASAVLTARGLTVALGMGMLLHAFAAGLALSWGSSQTGGLSFILRLFSGELSSMESTILWQARLPRVWFAGLAGAMLAAGGAVFQGILRNPLADPYVLGIAGGAALGATLGLVAGAGGVFLGLGVAGAGFLGAIMAVLVVLGVERRAAPGASATHVLLLTGVMLNAFAASCIVLVQSLVSAQTSQQLLHYLMGSLAVEGLARPLMAGLSLVVAGCLGALWWLAPDVNALGLGDEEAQSLGVHPQRVRLWAVLAVSSGVAAVVSFTGIVGFVGLVVPHGLRLWTGSDQRLLVPLSALVGAAFLTLADLAARSAFGLFATTLPVGVVTSLLGVPVFVYFLSRSRGAM